jgi:phage terminase Nu1 subunit (DNA packaging protein)
VSSQAEVAEHLFLNQASVSDLVRRGVLAKVARGAYDLVACRKAYILHIREQAAGRAAVTAEDGEELLDLVQQRARLAKEQADKTAMENAARRAETITRTDFVRATQGVIVQARAKLLSIPSKLAAVLAGIDTPRAVQDRLTTAIHEALAELAGTRGVSSPPGEPGSGGSDNGSDEGVGAAAPPDRKRVGRPKPKVKPRGKRRAGKLGHKPS